MNEYKIIPYVEPIFRFCCRRLSNRYDAEDLASEIVCHVLEGMKKYRIESLDAWIWRVAHNRYARFIDAQSKTKMILAENAAIFDTAASAYCYVDEASIEHKYETVFQYLHTLSSEYRNIFVDYYIGEMSIRTLSKKYSLLESPHFGIVTLIPILFAYAVPFLMSSSLAALFKKEVINSIG